MAERRGRGGQRLWTLTYGQIAEWTGQTVGAVRKCSQRGEFERDNLDSVLKFVNSKRERSGKPMIGVPAESPDPVFPLAGVAGMRYDPESGEFS